MKKNFGSKAQAKGHKRVAKNIARKQHKVENTMYLVKLMQKYGAGLKLQQRPEPGQKYWEWYLTNRGNEETNNG